MELWRRTKNMKMPLMKREFSQTLPRIFLSMATTIGLPPPCMGMLPVQPVVGLTPTDWWKELVITTWLLPNRCGATATATEPVGVVAQVEVEEQQAWAASLVPKADSWDQLMARREKPYTALSSQGPKKHSNRKMIQETPSIRKRLLSWWVIFAHILGMKIGALQVLGKKMPMALSTTWTSPTTRTACRIPGPFQTRTLSSRGLIAHKTWRTATGACHNVAEWNVMSRSGDRNQHRLLHQLRMPSPQWYIWHICTVHWRTKSALQKPFQIFFSWGFLLRKYHSAVSASWSMHERTNW